MQAIADGSRTTRRLFKKAVQQDRSKRRGKAYSFRYVEPLSAARTPLADFFNSLLGRNSEKWAEGATDHPFGDASAKQVEQAPSEPASATVGAAPRDRT